MRRNRLGSQSLWNVHSPACSALDSELRWLPTGTAAGHPNHCFLLPAACRVLSPKKPLLLKTHLALEDRIAGARESWDVTRLNPHLLPFLFGPGNPEACHQSPSIGTDSCDVSCPSSSYVGLRRLRSVLTVSSSKALDSPPPPCPPET